MLTPCMRMSSSGWEMDAVGKLFMLVISLEGVSCRCLLIVFDSDALLFLASEVVLKGELGKQDLPGSCRSHDGDN